ncbi:MAG: small basic family protein [Phascolarctobacterium sp.]|nr:small basic family protein [Phascolarctobacterium sp.]
MIYAALIGLIIGVVAGIYCPFSVPPEYARLLAVAVMAGLDAVLGGIRASMESKYDTGVFISGFFINGVLAAFLCYAGAMIGIDLYMVAIFIFGMRIFQNIGVIRRLYMGK